MKQGIVYVAAGDKYVREAVISAHSLRQHMPDAHITLFSTDDTSHDVFDEVILFESCGVGLRDRTLCLQRSPYERTLFLDSDTYVCDDVSDLFDLLDRFDMASTHAPNRRNVAQEGVPASFPQFNLGLFVFRKSEVMNALFADWLRRYDAEDIAPGQRHLSQPSFRIAVYHSPVRFALLTPEYNCRFYDSGYLEGPVKILHGHASAEQLAQIASAFNRYTGQRVHTGGQVLTQHKTGRIVRHMAIHRVASFQAPVWQLALRRLKKSIQSQGLQGTLRRLLSRLKH